MSRTLSDRLSEAARGAFVGRDAEVRSLSEAMLAPEPEFAVAFIHGPGGIGKSSLLRAIVDSLPKDHLQLRLDCRDIEPTAHGLLSAIADRIGIDPERIDLETLSGRLSDDPRRIVITLDNYETFGLVDSWIRQALLPALPTSVVTLIASRGRSSPGWSTDPGWADMFREIELAPLSEAQSLKLLCSRGLSEEQARRINEFTRGHPLALELAAAAGRAHPDLNIEEAAIPHVVGRLTEILLAGLHARTVEALEAASTVRRVTEPLLASLLESPSVRREFDAVRSLSFVSALHDGLVLHDVMRDTISYGLAQRDAARHAKYRSRAWQYLSDTQSGRSARTVWQYTADLLYLVQNPHIRNAFFRTGSIEVSFAPAQPADRAALEEICASTESPASAQWLVRWLDRHPETFIVARTTAERVAGCYIMFERGGVDPALLRDDPVTAAWCAHLDANPVLPHERVLFCRRWLAREVGEGLGPVQAAAWLDMKRLYMELKPNIRRVYAPVVDIACFAPLVTPLGFVPIEQAHVVLDGLTYYTAMLDFGPGSIDGWLSRLIGVELAAETGARATGDAPKGARASPFLQWINASRGEEVQLVNIEEVRYFQSDTKYTRMVATGREWLISKTIKELVEELDPGMFLQMHRATIVNLGAVESVARDEKGHVVLRLKGRKELLTVSQPYTHHFRQM